MNEAEQLAAMGTDGKKWAEEFWSTVRNTVLRETPAPLPSEEHFVDHLRSWFANAIEAGRSAGFAEGIAAARNTLVTADLGQWSKPHLLSVERLELVYPFLEKAPHADR